MNESCAGMDPLPLKEANHSLTETFIKILAVLEFEGGHITAGLMAFTCSKGPETLSLDGGTSCSRIVMWITSPPTLRAGKEEEKESATCD